MSRHTSTHQYTIQLRFVLFFPFQSNMVLFVIKLLYHIIFNSIIIIFLTKETKFGFKYILTKINKQINKNL